MRRSLSMLMNSVPPFCPPPPAIDAAVLAQLRELDPGGQAGIVARVLSTYRKSLQEALPAFEPALAQGDAEGLRRLAHLLKSASASVGAMQLSRLCLQVESAARNAEASVLREGVIALTMEAQRVLEALPPEG